MVKKLIFVMTADGNSEGNRALAIHFASIKRYSHIFDEAMCVIHEMPGAKDGEYSRLGSEFVKSCSCGKVDVSVRKVPNDKVALFLYESDVFYKDVIHDKNNEGKVIFFSHAKGYTKYSGKDTYRELDSWVTALWFLNLEYYDIHEYLLKSHYRVYFSGGLYGQLITDPQMNIYNGTFFWVNPGAINEFEGDTGEPNSRWYAELFPSRYDEYNQKFPNYILYPLNYYYESSKAIPWLLQKVDESGHDGTARYKGYLRYLSDETGSEITDVTIPLEPNGDIGAN